MKIRRQLKNNPWCAIAISFSLATSLLANETVTHLGPPSKTGRPGEDLVVLLVDKTGLKASLTTLPEAGKAPEVLKNFTVAIGKERGDKQKQGDNKTPEGVYLTESIINGSSLPAKYGPFAIPLNYPNPIDRIDGKTGYGIWLHGVINDERVEEANVTEGCVAFYNADIRALTEWLRPEQGVVVIADSLAAANRDEDVKAVQAATLSWLGAWSERNIESYINYYAPEFSSAGLNRDAYKNYKGNVFRSYKNMSIKIDKLRVITHPKYAVSLMDQDFQGDERFKAGGRKLLYWKKQSNGSWQIVREVHENRRFEFVKFSIEDSAAGRQAAVITDKQKTLGSPL